MERAGLKRFLMPSIGDLLFVSIFLRLLSLGGTLLNDGDTGWHLVAGESILKTLSIPHTETYSYTATGIEWISHEWLSELFFALVHRLGGLNGVIVFSAAIIAFTFWLAYRLMLKRGINPLTAALFTVFAASVSASSMLARPHIISYLLMLSFFWILEDFQRGLKDRLWLLPLLIALWANLHAAFFLGLVFVLLYAFGNLLYWYMGESKPESAKRARRLFLVLAASVMAALINPHGPSIFSFPFKLIGQEDIIGNIHEWASPDFHKTKAFEAMLLGVIAILVLSRKRPNLFEGGVLVMLAHLALSSQRFIPMFAVIVAPVAAARLEEVSGELFAEPRDRSLERIRMRLSALSGMEPWFRGHITPILVVVTAAAIALNGGYAGGSRLMDYRFSAGRFPVEAFEYAASNGINGRVFNKDGWGGYMLYKGYPEYKVFIDGRFETYGPRMMKEYLAVSKAKLGCTEILDKYKVDWVMFDSGSQLCRLLEAKGWKNVYSDQTAEILLRRKSL